MWLYNWGIQSLLLRKRYGSLSSPVTCSTNRSSLFGCEFKTLIGRSRAGFKEFATLEVVATVENDRFTADDDTFFSSHILSVVNEEDVPLALSPYGQGYGRKPFQPPEL